MTDQTTCRFCRFWVSSVDQPRNGQALQPGEGECRRRAPVGGGVTAYFSVSKKPNKMIAVMYPWPVAHEGDWCGEFIGLTLMRPYRAMPQKFPPQDYGALGRGSR